MQVQYTVKYTEYQSTGRCDQGVLAAVILPCGVKSSSSSLASALLTFGVSSRASFGISKKLKHDTADFPHHILKHKVSTTVPDSKLPFDDKMVTLYYPVHL